MNAIVEDRPVVAVDIKDVSQDSLLREVKRRGIQLGHEVTLGRWSKKEIKLYLRKHYPRTAADHDSPLGPQWKIDLRKAAQEGDWMYFDILLDRR